MTVELVSYTLDPLFTCEQAACECYDSEPDEDHPTRILNACIKNGHQSVAEHANFTFRITGISRACLAQLTRHRLAAFSVRSQRYCKEDNFGYVTPPSIDDNPKAAEVYHELMRVINNAYSYLTDKCGITNEDARFVLPNSCETTLTMTVNLRELIHICHERMCTRAQWEIRKLVSLMANEVIHLWPEAERWLRPKCEADPNHPFCPERNGCGMHPKLSEVYKDE